MRRCSSIASMKMIQYYTGMYLGEEMFEKIPGVTRGYLVITPPGCSGFRAIFPVRIFF